MAACCLFCQTLHTVAVCQQLLERHQDAACSVELGRQTQLPSALDLCSSLSGLPPQSAQQLLMGHLLSEHNSLRFSTSPSHVSAQGLSHQVMLLMHIDSRKLCKAPAMLKPLLRDSLWECRDVITLLV